jgi:hypothetical protein
MENNFHNELSNFVKTRDVNNANRVILNELAKALVSDKESYVEVLRSSGVNVYDGATEEQLIDSFVKNAPNNKQLVLGMAYLVNHRNQTVNFDGESEVSDSGVKDAYKIMDEYYNAGGAWAGAVKSIADVGGQIGGKAMDAQAFKKRGASSMLAQQQQARRDLTQSVIAQKQNESAEKLKQQGQTKKYLIIGGITVAALLIGVGIYFAVKNKNK